MEQLKTARKVVEDVLRNKRARAIFGEPVDTSVHTTYSKVVKKPMDLGTVLSRIPSGDTAKGRGRGLYRTVKEVLDDVNLVWANCFAYNCQPQDEPTRKLCDSTRKAFESKWQAAGLPVAPVEKEEKPADENNGKLEGSAGLLQANTVDVPSTHFLSPGRDQVNYGCNLLVCSGITSRSQRC